MPATDRLDDLETKIAYQQEVIDDLSATVVSQWKEIDRLTREMAALAERVSRAEQSEAGDPADEPPPPHY